MQAYCIVVRGGPSHGVCTDRQTYRHAHSNTSQLYGDEVINFNCSCSHIIVNIYSSTIVGWQYYPIGLLQKPPAAHCLVDNTQLYRNSRHIFNRQNLGKPQPQTISDIGGGHCGRKIIPWKQGPISRKFCAIRHNAHFLPIIYSLSIFPQVTTEPRGEIRQVWYLFSAFIVDERFIFVSRYIESVRSYALPRIGGGSAKCRQNLRFSPPKFLGWGKVLKVSFKA